MVVGRICIGGVCHYLYSSCLANKIGERRPFFVFDRQRHVRHYYSSYGEFEYTRRRKEAETPNLPCPPTPHPPSPDHHFRIARSRCAHHLPLVFVDAGVGCVGRGPPHAPSLSRWWKAHGRAAPRNGSPNVLQSALDRGVRIVSFSAEKSRGQPNSVTCPGVKCDDFISEKTMLRVLPRHGLWLRLEWSAWLSGGSLKKSTVDAP